MYVPSQWRDEGYKKAEQVEQTENQEQEDNETRDNSGEGDASQTNKTQE